MKRTGMAARMDRIGLKKRKKSSVGRVPKLVEGGDLSLFSLSVKFFFSLLYIDVFGGCWWMLVVRYLWPANVSKSVGEWSRLLLNITTKYKKGKGFPG